MSELEKEIRKMTDGVNGWGDRVDGFVKTIVEICEHYADVLGHDPIQVFKALEDKRTYSYPNYYQWAKFPKLDEVTIYKNQTELREAVQGKKGFRCPVCKGVSMDPYECNSGQEMSKGKVCDWKAYGLLKTAGKGFVFTVAEDWLLNPHVEEIFMPIVME